MAQKKAELEPQVEGLQKAIDARQAKIDSTQDRINQVSDRLFASLSKKVPLSPLESCFRLQVQLWGPPCHVCATCVAMASSSCSPRCAH